MPDHEPAAAFPSQRRAPVGGKRTCQFGRRPKGDTGLHETFVLRVQMPRYLLCAIRIQAFHLARSGDFANCRSIEAELTKSERERAGLALRDPTIRSHIDLLCADASGRADMQSVEPHARDLSHG